MTEVSQPSTQSRASWLTQSEPIRPRKIVCMKHSRFVGQVCAISLSTRLVRPHDHCHTASFSAQPRTTKNLNSASAELGRTMPSCRRLRIDGRPFQGNPWHFLVVSRPPSTSLSRSTLGRSLAPPSSSVLSLVSQTSQMSLGEFVLFLPLPYLCETLPPPNERDLQVFWSHPLSQRVHEENRHSTITDSTIATPKSRSATGCSVLGFVPIENWPDLPRRPETSLPCDTKIRLLPTQGEISKLG
jgi:hypothetical protein